MAESIEFQIVKDLQAALLGIAIAAGFHSDLQALAVKLDPDQNVEDLIGAEAKRPFVILELTPDEFTYQPALVTTITMPLTIHVVSDFDPTDDDSFLRTYLRGCADVEQAIAADVSRGGLAVDTRILSREFQKFEAAQVWAMVKTEVRVRRRYGAPNA